MALRLVVGLGNPGDRYARTRHNVGFRLLDRLAGGERWREFEGGLGHWLKRGDLYLAKPSTFMNESGRFVAAFSRFYKIGADELLVCFDDVALPLGRLRLRRAGSAGGQKGMKSVIDHLGTDAVMRLRLGIGPQPERMDSADFVLARFTAEEEERLGAVLGDAEEAVGLVREQGIEAAMNRYNPAPESAA